MPLTTISSPRLNEKDLTAIIHQINNKVLTERIYEPDTAYSLSEVCLELSMTMKAAIDELHSGNCEELIDQYLFLKKLKSKNPTRYQDVLRWNHLEGVA